MEIVNRIHNYIQITFRKWRSKHFQGRSSAVHCNKDNIDLYL